ncbi:MAG: PD-(D/E)XK nuclease family protein [Cyclobacteriaceae bacterium]|nr:PD-(D/E)XK nuclease family protein [Cyclobacteriaceae bacterium]
MESFLRELARKVSTEPQFEQLTFVFPNRRATLYFRKHLAEVITKPVFAPHLITIEDFIASFSGYQVPDKLELVHRLHNIYDMVVGPKRESFDEFYFWGEMLLLDFNEIDKYLVNAEQLFRDLRNQKELDSSFDYLTDDQKRFLLEFWNEFDDHITENKQQFLSMWNKLFTLYTTYRQQLQAQQLAYEGLVHREVAENISALAGNKYVPTRLRFVGFNALTKAEEKIICYFVDKGSQVIWDGDEYYVNNETQEAGDFFREYQQHEILKQTFTNNFPSNFRGNKSIKVFGAAQPIGQAKLLGQILQQELANGLEPEDTLIVLPDEKLLMPVLFGLPQSIDKLNVTMGYALANTSFFNLIELLVELQIGKRKEYYNHRQVLALLAHPYVIAADAGLANSRRREIQKSNWVQVPQNYLASVSPLHRIVFGSMDMGLLPYLQSVLREVGSLESILDLDREFAFQFIKLLNRIQDIMGVQTQEADRKEFVKSLRSFLRLLRQLARAEKIPFSGEPLKGLQIMGVLETRNLDYKNVFVLSLNEGAFPAFGGKGSYVPFNIRKAYALPTTEHQDAMYAYLFYRMLQRAENVFLFYNTETDQLGQGEKSRYLQQLIFESGLELQTQVLHNTLKPLAVEPVIIPKTAEVLQALLKLNEGNPLARTKGLSPSALAAYLDCSLQFYFKHVLRMREPNEVEDELGARELGNFLHQVMEKFYKNLAQHKRNKSVEPGDFADAKKVVDKLIDEAFATTFNMEPGKKIEYEGQSVVIQQLVRNFAIRILENDQHMAPFTMEAIEQDGLLHRMKISHAPGYAVLGGKIDRVDRKENVVRIVDYKTGGDKLDFESVASLFDRAGKKRQKAVFQTLLYGFLYQTNFPLKADDQMITGIINREILFSGTEFGLTINKQPVYNVLPLMEEFSLHLKALLEEIFNPEVPFKQTTETATCKFCPYKSICYRN